MLFEILSSKFLPLLCLACVLVGTATFFGLRDRRYTGWVPILVEQHRDIVGVIVQVLSNALSILEVLVLCSLTNFAMRIRLFHTPATLPDLGFWSALSIPRLDTTLPWIRLLILGAVVALGPLFGAIWSGSLTPIATTAVASRGKIAIPVYPVGVDPTFYLNSDGSINMFCKRPVNQYNPNVLDMTTCPALDLASALMASARTATSLHGPHLHTKLDNNDWTYIGRSYGVGSSQGLFEPTKLDQNSANSFSYMETGYNATVSCKNTTINSLNFYFYTTDTSSTLAYADTLTTPSKNMSIPLYQVDLQDEGQPFFAWATCFNCSASTDHLLATYDIGNWYAGLGNNLCSVAFRPTMFNVTVSVTNSTITVLPTAQKATFDLDNTLAEAVMNDLDLFSRTSSNTGVSALGVAVSYNVKTVNATQPGLEASRLYNVALEGFVTSLLDDLLVARATEQMIIYQNHTDVDVQAVSPAVVIGTRLFHYAQLCVCIGLTIVYCVEALRTRFWAELPTFNFVETASLADAAMRGREGRRSTVQSTQSSSSARVTAFYTRDGRPRLRFEYAEPSHKSFHGGDTKGHYNSVQEVDPL